MQKITLRNQRAGTSAKHNQHDHILNGIDKMKHSSCFLLASTNDQEVINRWGSIG